MNVRRTIPSRKVRELVRKAGMDIPQDVLKVRESQLERVRKQLIASKPLKVYVLGTLSITEQENLEAAVPVAWRFLILRGQQVRARDAGYRRLSNWYNSGRDRSLYQQWRNLPASQYR